MPAPVMWMVRGDSGRLYEEFKEGQIVAIGWWELHDAKPGMSRETLAKMYATKRPEFKHGTIIAGASQVWRFLNEVETNADVITYNPSTRKYLIGRIDGPPSAEQTPKKRGVSLIRKVTWVGEIDRDQLSTTTKNSLGSTLTIFRVPDSAASEVLAVLKQGRRIQDSPDETTTDTNDSDQDTTTLLEDIEVRAAEFIKDLITRLDWNEMQELVAGILRAMGYKTRVSKLGSDRGADIFASPDGLGFETPRIVVGVKHRQGQTESKELRSFLGGRHKDDRGLYVSTGGFTKDSRYEADRASIPVTLWELDDIVRSIVENYESLDAETKQLVPLKRLYWPAQKGG